MTITLSRLAELFVADKQAEGRSPRTIEWYQQKLNEFIRWAGNGHEPILPEFTLDLAREYITHLQTKSTRFEDNGYRPTEEGGLSSFTIAGHVRTLKAFAAWLAEDGFTKSNVLSRLKNYKVKEAFIDVLSAEEIKAIVNAINPNCVLGARLHAMIILLLDTGVRATELCSLTLDNVHLEEGYIKVVGKGNKERIVGVGPTAVKSMLRYLTTWRPALAVNDTEDAFFLSETGGALTYSGLGQAIKRLGRKAGVERLRAHLFRHTFAVRYLLNGGDLMSLRLTLGHTTIAVTQMYLHLADSHVQALQHKYSPVESLGLGKRRGRAK